MAATRPAARSNPRASVKTFTFIFILLRHFFLFCELTWWISPTRTHYCQNDNYGRQFNSIIERTNIFGLTTNVNRTTKESASGNLGRTRERKFVAWPGKRPGDPSAISISHCIHRRGMTRFLRPCPPSRHPAQPRHSCWNPESLPDSPNRYRQWHRRKPLYLPG